MKHQWAKQITPSNRIWKCLQCGEVFQGDELPEFGCPGNNKLKDKQSKLF